MVYDKESFECLVFALVFIFLCLFVCFFLVAVSPKYIIRIHDGPGAAGKK